jgi:hypothetical protein
MVTRMILILSQISLLIDLLNTASAVAAYVSQHLPGPYYFTPINEITFFSFCGGEWGWVAPYKKTKEERFSFRLQLCKAAIAGVKAIRKYYLMQGWSILIHWFT